MSLDIRGGSWGGALEEYSLRLIGKTSDKFYGHDFINSVRPYYSIGDFAAPHSKKTEDIASDEIMPK